MVFYTKRQANAHDGGINVQRNVENARFLSNAHTHTPFCDGISAVEDIIAAAKQLGFVSLGFSGHGKQEFDFAYCMGHEKQCCYENMLRALQIRFRNEGESPCIWIGLEQDAMVDEAQKAYNRQHFDYILGSTHYLTRDFHGVPVSVDGDFTTLNTYVAEVFMGDWTAMVRAYYDALVDMLRRDRPQIIGHFDLVRKQGFLTELFYYPIYRRIALRALELAHSCEGVLEVNTGGMAKGIMDEPHPARELLGAWLEMGGEVTLTSDCHDVKHLDYGLDDMLGKLKRLGFKSFQRLGTGKALWETMEL